VSSNFVVDPNDIGIGHLLPQSVRSIRNKEGIHGAISYCFRTPPAIGENEVDMDLAFDVLKKLNTYGTELKRRYSQHIKNSAPDVYNKVVFHIGQAVHHTPSNCRCVVTGWEIDMATGQQLVESIADQADVEEIVRVGDSFPGTAELHASEDFVLITDPALMRINHQSLPLYFNDFNISNGRYQPTDDLAFRYPFDFPNTVENTEDGMIEETASVGVLNSVSSIGELYMHNIYM
jgi:hypothetical protein